MYKKILVIFSCFCFLTSCESSSFHVLPDNTLSDTNIDDGKIADIKKLLEPTTQALNPSPTLHSNTGTVKSPEMEQKKAKGPMKNKTLPSHKKGSTHPSNHTGQIVPTKVSSGSDVLTPKEIQLIDNTKDAQIDELINILFQDAEK